jgi:hypothetical protein
MLTTPVHREGQFQDEGRRFLSSCDLLRLPGGSLRTLHASLPLTLFRTPVCPEYSGSFRACQDLFLIQYMKNLSSFVPFLPAINGRGFLAR